MLILVLGLGLLWFYFWWDYRKLFKKLKYSASVVQKWDAAYEELNDWITKYGLDTVNMDKPRQLIKRVINAEQEFQSAHPWIDREPNISDLIKLLQNK